MSSIGFREWEVWTNQTWFGTDQEVPGYYLLKITPGLMTSQTVEFIRERIEEVRLGRLVIGNASAPYFQPGWSGPDDLSLVKHERLRTSANLLATIQRLMGELDALSVCVDFSLTCGHLEYVVPPGEPVPGRALVATRRPLGRGMAFEVEERGAARQKILRDYDFYLKAGHDLKVAMKHYLNGLTLLGLEDSFSGLIDAAFMQFYQACEILCGNNYKLTEAKKYIARLGYPDALDLQVVAHHVWQVRHGYFGHGNANNLLYSSPNLLDTFNVAKQVLVARWLARRLADGGSPSGAVLCREMRLYHAGSSEAFCGTVAELETTFRLPYAYRDVDQFDATGAATGRRHLI